MPARASDWQAYIAPIIREIRESRSPVVPPEDPSPASTCIGGPPSFSSASGGSQYEEPGTTVDWGDGHCPSGTTGGGGFTPIGFQPSNFSPLSARAGECGPAEEIVTWNEIGRQYRIVRVRNPQDSDQYVDVEEALVSIFQTPEGNRRLIWGQQPPPDETLGEGFRGQRLEPTGDGNSNGTDNTGGGG